VLATVPNLSEAANILGSDQATLYRKRKKLNLQQQKRIAKTELKQSEAARLVE